MEAHASPWALGMFCNHGEKPFAGLVLDQAVWPVPELLQDSRLLAEGVASATVFDLIQQWPTAFTALCDAVATRLNHHQPRPIDSLRILAPLPEARQVVCTGANYRKHVIDLVTAQGAGSATVGQSVEERRLAAARRVDERAANGIPYAFPKLAGSLAGPFDDVVVPYDATQLDWELELGVVIGRAAWRVSRDHAMNVVAGYLIVNDITRRELVYRTDMPALGSDWLRCKSGPGFMPHGPLFVPSAFVPNPHALELQLEVNGRIMQQENTSDMLFSIERQIEYVSSYARLLPGDILATGSPAGNGMHHGVFLQPGDVMRASITGLGTQISHCVAEEI